MQSEVPLKQKNTKFAPAERLGKQELLNELQKVEEYGSLKDIFMSMPEVALILNRQRQIIYSNEALLSLLGDPDGHMILGQRPGEVIKCIHSKEYPGGCGTSESCRYCGAINAVLESQKSGKKVEQECRIVSFIEDEEVSFDYRVTASPIMIGSSSFTMVFMIDISHQKRKIALERIFFHDIINIAGGIKGFSEFLKRVEEPVTMKEYVRVVDQLSHDLLDELHSHRAIALAENGDLKTSPVKLEAYSILEEVKNTVSYHVIATDKEIILNNSSVVTRLVADPVLLKRVIINMAKNALEATEERGQVLLGYYPEADNVTFFVHNDQYMSRDIQLQVFKRSFSTRGEDRGLGTYSIKLLAERYLGGEVWFETHSNKGTTFFVMIPLAPVESKN